MVMMSDRPTDPVEAIIYDALVDSDVPFEMGKNGIDFYMSDSDIYIECKRFHSDRISDQMARVDNIIAVQGICTARALAGLIRSHFK